MPRSELRDRIPQGHRDFLADMLEPLRRAPAADDDCRARPPSDDAAPMSYDQAVPLMDVAFAHPIKLIVNALGSPPPDMVERARANGVTGRRAGRQGRPRRAPRRRRGRPGHRPGLRGRRAHRRDRHDGARPRDRRRGGAGAGPRRRRHRRRAPDGRRAGPRRRGRVVRVDLADHRGGRDPPAGQGEVPRRDVVGHAALAQPHRQAGPPAPLRMDRRVGVAGVAGPAADAAAADPDRRGVARASTAPPRRSTRVRAGSPATSSARSSAR